ncbi:MAG TPA: EboA domain-containing protein [Vicinamibacterales bacterium]|nr:EboA domain-containing protein [Vicinamibacterales bacterium]
MTTVSPRDRLLEMVRPRVSEAAWHWLEQAMEESPAATLDALAVLYTRVAAKVGTGPVRPALDPQPPAFDRWTVADAARAALLLTIAERTADADAFVKAALACYERGDSAEQLSWLKSTAILPWPDRFLGTVIDACRTNILPLFEAVACENPYPAQHFPDRNFNQLVLKALFNGVALSRIVGLPGRLNAELTRMAGDYADERRAAGRAVPADIGLAMKNRST